MKTYSLVMAFVWFALAVVTLLHVILYDYTEYMLINRYYSFSAFDAAVCSALAYLHLDAYVRSNAVPVERKHLEDPRPRASDVEVYRDVNPARGIHQSSKRG